MNKEVLTKLMKLKKINSYYQLAKHIDISYTTLLDLINGKGERLSNFKIIATYFNVPLTILVEDLQYFIVIDKSDKVRKIAKLSNKNIIYYLIND